MSSEPDPPSILRSIGSHEVLRTNRSFEGLLQLTDEDLRVRPLVEWIHPDDQAALKRALDSGAGFAHARHRTKTEDWVCFDWLVKTGEGGTFALGRLGPEPGTPARPSSAAATAAASKAETLEAMARIVETSNPGMRCSILLVDQATGRVTVGAGPSLPAAYNNAVEGLHIGPTVGSCGTAAYWNVPVVVEDIANDYLWRELRDAAALAGVRACWSHPIITTTGSVLGAVALYADEPRVPFPSQMDGLAIAARMIGLALERDRLEDQLRQSAQLEAIGRLAGGIAHDFNNLLTVILGHVELMRQNAPAAPEPQILEAISQAVDRASRITSQLLAFGRRQTHHPERVELGEVVLDVVRVLRPVIGDQISVSVVTDPEARSAMIDRTQLGQIMLNLVLNARDAMPAGGQLDIETRPATSNEIAQLHLAHSQGTFMAVTVTDNGRGMDAHTRTHVFEPFFSTKEGRHSGLGLATVYGLTRQNGGYVSVRSEVNQGTTFSLFFPTHVATASRKDAGTGEQQGLASVLIVEDNDGTRDLVTQVLMSEGCPVVGERD